jgi:hypothetical protein
MGTIVINSIPIPAEMAGMFHFTTLTGTERSVSGTGLGSMLFRAELIVSQV